MTKNNAAMILMQQGIASLKGSLALHDELRKVPAKLMKHPAMVEQNAILLASALQALEGLSPLVETI